MKRMLILILIVQSLTYWHLGAMLNEVGQTASSDAGTDVVHWKVSFEVSDEVKKLLLQASDSEVRA